MNARFRALAVLIAVFLLGFSAGLLSYHLMRSKVGTGSVAAFGPAGAFGNRAMPGRERGGPPRLQQQLLLSPDQQTQFDSIMKEIRPQFDAVRAEEEKKLEPIRAEMNPKFEAVRAEMGPKFDAIRAEMNRRISSILNEDQRKKFEAIQKEREGRGERGGPRRHPDHPGPPPEVRQ
jgi:hypothetical protein